MKYSNDKFVKAMMNRQKPKSQEPITGFDLSRARDIADPQRRMARLAVPELVEDFEPVSFHHPEENRLVHGWLVAVDGAGNARVEYDQGEYAVVPPSELIRIASQEEQAAAHEELRRKIGQVVSLREGIRADIHTTSIADVGDGEEVVSLSFSASMEAPNREEIAAYLAFNHPTASIREIHQIEQMMPGRIAVLVSAETKEAEMGPAVGGTVTETLDPEDVMETDTESEVMVPEPGHVDVDGVGVDAKKASHTLSRVTVKATTPRTAANWFGEPNSQNLSPADAANSLMQAKDQDLTERVLESYLKQGGAAAIAKTRGKFDTRLLLEAAIPVVQRSDPRLWKQVVSQSTQGLIGQEKPIGTYQKPKSPSEGNKPVQNTKPTNSDENMWSEQGIDQAFEGLNEQPASTVAPQTTPSATTPQAPQTPQTSTALPQSSMSRQQAETALAKSPDTAKIQGPVREQLIKRLMDGLMDEDDAGATQPGVSSPEAVNVGPKMGSRKTSRAVAVNEMASADSLHKEASSLLDHGLPPALKEIWKDMSLTGFARRGDYTVASMSWDPKVLASMSEWAVKDTIRTFVNAKCGIRAQGMDFGVLGRVYFDDFSKDKGTATVRFSSQLVGPSATEVE